MLTTCLPDFIGACKMLKDIWADRRGGGTCTAQVLLNLNKVLGVANPHTIASSGSTNGRLGPRRLSSEIVPSSKRTSGIRKKRVTSIPFSQACGQYAPSDAGMVPVITAFGL